MEEYVLRGFCIWYSGMAFIYVLAPVFDNMIAKIKPMMLRVMCVFLLMLFGIDMVYSHYVPNVGEGITDYGDGLGLRFSLDC